MREIPLTPSQNGSFDIDIENRRYTLVFRYVSRPGIESWSMDLSLGGVVLLTGVPAVIGVELFQGHAIPDIPRGLVMVPIDERQDDASFDELGTRVKLVLIEEGDGIDTTTI